MMSLFKCIQVVSFICLIPYYLHVCADFIYEDFNQTLGLNINGDADTSGCQLNETYVTKDYDDETDADSSIVDSNKTVIISRGDDLQSKQTFVTNQNASSDDLHINELEAQFGHRDVYLPSFKNGCKRRLRLTPASKSKAGSVFYEKRLPVVSWFVISLAYSKNS